MTGRAERPRGQPVLVFASILGGWAIMRVLLWTSPFPNAPTLLGESLPSGPGEAPRLAQADPLPAASIAPARAPKVAAPWLAAPVPYAAVPVDSAFTPVWREPPPPPLAAQALPLPAPVRGVVSHYMLLAAGMSNMTLPPEIAALYERGPAATGNPVQLAAADRPLLGEPGAPARAASLPSDSRWSADGWLMWRQDAGTSAAPGTAAYGRSQAGAVVRYRLAAGPHRPAVYARATQALEGPRQRELAVGLAARPLAGLPVTLAAEARVTEGPAGRELRPSAFAVTELPPAALPLGLRGEAYVQAGYVGGRDATAFVDGQARADRQLARLGNEAELRAGLAAWGGAQKGAARLDLGPSATLGFRLGDAPSRIAVDYRFRVAGDAHPRSGPALTFSAGF